MTSAYPVSVDELIPAVRELAAESGRLPSRNKVMATFRVGAAKASRVLDEVRTSMTPTATPEPAANPTPVRLTVVPEPVEPTDPDTTKTGSGEPTDPDIDQAAETVSPSGEKATTDPDTTLNPAGGTDATGSVDQPSGEVNGQVGTVGHPGVKAVPAWPLWLLAAPAFIAVWSGWVGLGGMTGFGMVRPLPGIADEFTLNTAITLPIGLETYGAYALSVWLSGRAHTRTARRFAAVSALASLVLGGAGQIAYHLMKADGVTVAPWPVTTVVACLPVIVLGSAAALRHLTTDHQAVTS